MKTIEQIGAEARAQGIPVISKTTWAVLSRCLEENKPKTVLEIGTAVGYSAALILSKYEGEFVGIEIDGQRYNEAVKNLAELYPGRKIVLLNEDAEAALIDLAHAGREFDFIFLDGPKGQYLKYYPYLKKLLNPGGILFCDNIFLHGLAQGDDYPKHKLRTMIVNLRKFYQILTEDKDFETQIIQNGEDDIALCKKL